MKGLMAYCIMGWTVLFPLVGKVELAEAIGVWNETDSPMCVEIWQDNKKICEKNGLLRSVTCNEPQKDLPFSVKVFKQINETGECIDPTEFVGKSGDILIYNGNDVVCCKRPEPTVP